MDQTEPREIPDTDGARQLFWSPRSDELGYLVANDLRKVTAAGPAGKIGRGYNNYPGYTHTAMYPANVRRAIMQGLPLTRPVS